MLVIVANRLPLEHTTSGWSVSPGGLVTALMPVVKERGGLWVGWSGETGADDAPFQVDGLTVVPIKILPAELESYYEGFSNSTLWPLYHDKVHTPQFVRSWWRPYHSVNRRFANRVAAVAPPEAAVWIHDYHLSLVPGMLRDLRPDLKLGFFLHIPFPPMELFAQLPWRRAILEGMLGADAVGFQTVYGARNFRAVVRRYLSAEVRGNAIRYGGRVTIADAFPISIDSAAFAELAALEETRRRALELRSELGNRRILLGVDRLDYTKGIGRRLRAFETLLDAQPALRDQVVFVQIVVPSRENVPGYLGMRESIEQLAGRINGKYSTVGQVPVHYRYASLDRPELVAHYRAADAMVVTPPRDGMNLVAKEYVACQVEGSGALILSEFTGAALELTRAILVNPYDLDGVAGGINEALTMGAVERRRRMRVLRAHVMANDVHKWARSALEAFHALT